MSLIGQYIVKKFRQSAREHGYISAAKRLRKQGIPCWLALEILLFAKD